MKRIPVVARLTAMLILWAMIQAYRPGSAIRTSLPRSIPLHFQGPASDTNSIEGDWYLVPVLAADTATGKKPHIRFNTRTNRFTGNTGCNSMNGTFRHADSSLVFDERIVVTKRACAGFNESAFLKSLLRTNYYRFENGMLVLMFNKEELSRWARKNYQPPVKKSV